MKENSKRAKKVRLSPVRAKDRTQIVWLSEQTNNELKAVKDELKLGAAEDAIIYLLKLYSELKKAKSQ